MQKEENAFWKQSSKQHGTVRVYGRKNKQGGEKNKQGGEKKISKKDTETKIKIEIEIETESKNNQQQGRCLLRGARFGVCVFEN